MDDVYNQKLEEAYKLHTTGSLDKAKLLYEELIKLSPENLDVLNLYAQLLFSLQDYDDSLKIFKEIFDKTELEDIKVNIIKIYLQKNDFESAINEINLIKNPSCLILRMKAQAFLGMEYYVEAANTYHKILNTDGASLSDLFNLSISYFRNKNYEKALKYVLEAYEYAPDDYSICIHLASVYQELNDEENQLKYLLKASEINPNIDLFYNIGVLYAKMKNDESALQYFEAIVKAEPDNKYANLYIARIYQNHDKNISLKIYQELAEKYPDDVNILTQLYLVAQDMMKNDIAYQTSLLIIKADPEEALSYSFAGDSLNALGRFKEAIEMFKKAKEYTPETEQEYYDSEIANNYSILNEPDKAIEIFKTKYKDSLSKSTTYAFIQLKEKNLNEVRNTMINHAKIVDKGDFIDKRAIKFFYKLNIDKKYGINEDTFKQVKKYADTSELEKIKVYQKKDLYNQNPDKKRVLVYNSNGIGDMIMFSRYVHILKKHTDRIILKSPKSMFRIMQYSFPDYKIILDNEDADENSYDLSTSYFCLLFSLKESDLKNIPYSSPYIFIDDKIIEEKSKLEIMQNNKKKIGIFWMGNPVVMAQRSVKFRKLMPLFDIKNTQIYSFQISDFDYDDEDVKKELPMINLATYIKDYADTAGFLKNIDVLVTIDTSIANLAGAMGIKTFLLLPYESEWRWFHDTDTTPWYDSVRIFKQTIPHVWDDVIDRVKTEIESLSNQH